VKWFVALLLVFVHSQLAFTQSPQDVIKRGETVFSQSCTGYCHATSGGGGSGAPRLAARGFEESYINNVVTRGVPGTVMPAFAATLSRSDLTAVVAYVATLNGITNPAAAGNTGAGAAQASRARALSPAASAGRDLFFDATRSFGRCSTCHEVNGMGIPVAAPITKVPANAQALRALSTPLVSTATAGGDSMPALVISNGARNVIFYDMTIPPPVLVTAEPSTVKFSDGSSWRHASVITIYKDAELESILTFLRAALVQ
jgi:mono/diheme cytochrome c family protein